MDLGLLCIFVFDVECFDNVIEVLDILFLVSIIWGICVYKCIIGYGLELVFRFRNVWVIFVVGEYVEGIGCEINFLS